MDISFRNNPGLDSASITHNDIDMDMFNTVKVNQRRDPEVQSSHWDEVSDLGKSYGSKKLKKGNSKSTRRKKKSTYAKVVGSTFDEKQSEIEHHMLNLVYQYTRNPDEIEDALNNTIDYSGKNYVEQQAHKKDFFQNGAINAHELKI
jgi:hypothetical protein